VKKGESMLDLEMEIETVEKPVKKKVKSKELMSKKNKTVENDKKLIVQKKKKTEYEEKTATFIYEFMREGFYHDSVVLTMDFVKMAIKFIVKKKLIEDERLNTMIDSKFKTDRYNTLTNQIFKDIKNLKEEYKKLEEYCEITNIVTIIKTMLGV